MNNDLIDQRLLFGEERSHIRMFLLNMTEDTVWLNVSSKLTAKERSTLGMCKDSVLAKHFDKLICVHQDKTASVKKKICEEVAKWVTAIEGMPDDIGTNFLANKVNGVVLIVMGRKDVKKISVTQMGPLSILFRGIENL